MPARPVVDTTPIEQLEALDRPVALLERVADAVLPTGRAREVLAGVPLGHALHPLLTDLPIGFWTSANVIDFVSPRKGRVAARRLVGLGVVSTLPTIASGLNDWRELRSTGRKRVGTVHAAANAAATLCYAASYLARRRGKQFRGVLWGLAGAGVATGGGYLGGHLAFGDDSTEATAGAPPASTAPATGSAPRHAAVPAHAETAPVPGGGSDDDRQPADAGATGTLGDRDAPVTELKPREAPPARPGPTPVRRHTGTG